MIFVALGTQKFPFNRLLKDIDELIEEKIITESVFAQTGNSSYVPKNYAWVKFLEPTDFKKRINECETFITHGGVGSIHNGLLLNKKVIVYPRLAIYNEHVDNHQMEIAEKYSELGYVLMCRDKCELKNCVVNELEKFKQNPFFENDNISAIEDSIIKYIKGECND